MFESLQHLINGFGIAATVQNLLYCLIGCIVGTIIGVLPGIGPIAGIALLIPATFGLNPTSAIIMLAGIYYGAMYGGSTTSILLNVPGETASVITCIDGYQMAQKGRAGPALAIVAIGSFIAGTIGIFGLVFLAPPLAEAALAFGPPEYFSLMVFGFIVLSNVTGKSLLKSLMMATRRTDHRNDRNRSCYWRCPFYLRLYLSLGWNRIRCCRHRALRNWRGLGQCQSTFGAAGPRSSHAAPEGTLSLPSRFKEIDWANSEGGGIWIRYRFGPRTSTGHCHLCFLYDREEGF